MIKQNRNKRILIVATLLLIVLIMHLFSKGPIRKKIFIGQNEYSVYNRSYKYADMLCSFFLFDCNRAGVIYFYDEIEKKVLESVSTGRIGAIESLKIDSSFNSIYFTAFDDIKIKNNEWTFPRPLLETKE